MFGGIRFHLEEKEVYRLVWGLIQATSPVGLTMFLDGTYKKFLQQRAQDRFAQAGDDVVGAWEALSPATPGFREQQGYDPGAPINVRSGQMRTWATSDASYTPIAHGVTMRYPGEIPRGKLKKKVTTAQIGQGQGWAQGNPGVPTPPRPVMGVGAYDLEAFLMMYSFWLVDFLRDPVDLGVAVA